jgi:hypothetical protein
MPCSHTSSNVPGVGAWGHVRTCLRSSVLFPLLHLIISVVYAFFFFRTATQVASRLWVLWGILVPGSSVLFPLLH